MAADRPRRAPALDAATASLAAVLRNPAIRNLQAAWALGVGADWALLVVAIIVAYDTGGPALVALVSLARMVPATIVNILVDAGRLARPERALVAVNLVRAAAAGGMAAAILADAPALVFVEVGVAAAAGALVRPTMMGLLPAVATTPDELVSANVVTALAESAGTFVGPLLAGIAVARSGPETVAALVAAVGVVAAVILLGVRVADAARPTPAERPRGLAIAEGLRALRHRPPAAAVMGSFLAQTAVRGALTTYLAVISVELLGMGDAGVGVLGAAMGIGGLVGALVALGLGARRGLAPMHVTALVLWGAPIAVIGLVPVPAVALVALAVVGVGNALLDVAGFTLLQRGIPNRSRSAVLSVLEASVGLGVSLGGVLGALALERLGIEAALVLTGLALPLAAVATWGPARRLDRGAVVPEHRAGLLRAIPLFRPLPLAALERLATGMRPASFDAGAPLMAEGESGDTYYVIERGEVEVSIAGRPLHRQGPGDGVGEIALLRAVPRTATVTALEPVAAWEIDCATFVDAVTGHEGSTAAASRVVEDRLGRGAATGA